MDYTGPRLKPEKKRYNSVGKVNRLRVNEKLITRQPVSSTPPADIDTQRPISSPYTADQKSLMYKTDAPTITIGRDQEPLNPFTARKFKKFRSLPRTPGFRSFVRTYAAYNQHSDPMSHIFMKRYNERSQSRNGAPYSFKSDLRLLRKTIVHDVQSGETSLLSYPSEFNLSHSNFIIQNVGHEPIEWELKVPPQIQLNKDRGTLGGGQTYEIYFTLSHNEQPSVPQQAILCFCNHQVFLPIKYPVKTSQEVKSPRLERWSTHDSIDDSYK